MINHTYRNLFIVTFIAFLFSGCVSKITGDIVSKSTNQGACSSIILPFETVLDGFQPGIEQSTMASAFSDKGFSPTQTVENSNGSVSYFYAFLENNKLCGQEYITFIDGKYDSSGIVQGIVGSSYNQ